MIKKALKYIIIAPLIMAFQREDDFEDSPLLFSKYNVNVVATPNLSSNDTLWVTGSVSSKAFDIELNDSVPTFNPLEDIFSIYKFMEPTTVANAKDAIDQFELVFEKGEFSTLPRCQNAQLQVNPKLDDDNNFYSYRLGLIPLNEGDYVISWQDALLQNQQRNEFILNRYPIAQFPNQIGFMTCEQVSWRYIDESDKEFFFSVE